jgi:hypothetical protein
LTPRAFRLPGNISRNAWITVEKFAREQGYHDPSPQPRGCQAAERFKSHQKIGRSYKS